MTKRTTAHRNQTGRLTEAAAVPVDIERVIEIRRAAIQQVRACDRALGWHTRIERTAKSENGRQGGE